MPFVRLRRHAPEVSGSITCCLCGVHTHAPPHDHLLVGTPGVPELQDTLCDTCGRVLERVVARWGPNLSFAVEQGQRRSQ